MKAKITVVSFFVFITFIGIGYSVYRVKLQSTHSSQIDPQVLGIQDPTKQQGIPTRLRIPSIGVDAHIEEVSVTPDGTMGVPSDGISVGWFSLGSRPGDRGSAVLSGHVDSADGSAAVFTHLHTLKAGEKVYVEDSTGKLQTFVVQRIKVYNSGYAEEVFTQNDGKYLNLSTCDGVWDQTKKSYNKRLVVFTTLEE